MRRYTLVRNDRSGGLPETRCSGQGCAQGSEAPKAEWVGLENLWR